MDCSLPGSSDRGVEFPKVTWHRNVRESHVGVTFFEGNVKGRSFDSVVFITLFLLPRVPSLNIWTTGNSRAELEHIWRKAKGQVEVGFHAGVGCVLIWPPVLGSGAHNSRGLVSVLWTQGVWHPCWQLKAEFPSCIPRVYRRLLVQSLIVPQENGSRHGPWMLSRGQDALSSPLLSQWTLQIRSGGVTLKNNNSVFVGK